MCFPVAWMYSLSMCYKVVDHFAVHGFHGKICTESTYHDPKDDCICKLCNKPCSKYHLQKCKNRTLSRIEQTKDFWNHSCNVTYLSISFSLYTLCLINYLIKWSALSSSHEQSTDILQEYLQMLKNPQMFVCC